MNIRYFYPKFKVGHVFKRSIQEVKTDMKIVTLRWDAKRREFQYSITHANPKIPSTFCAWIPEGEIKDEWADF